MKRRATIAVARSNHKFGCVSQDIELPGQTVWTAERETVHPEERQAISKGQIYTKTAE